MSKLLTNTTDLQEVLEVLQNKAAGGGGEDVTSETSAYTSKLATLESSVLALKTELQNKASGGSGSGSTPATVTLDGTLDGFFLRVVYEDPEGNIHDYFDELGLGEIEFPTTFTTTVGSWVYIIWDISYGVLNTTGARPIHILDDGTILQGVIIKITETTATIQVSHR